MMEGCPEEFEDRLIEIIDEIEIVIDDIKELLDITCIDHLSDIPAAFEIVESLSKDLY